MRRLTADEKLKAIRPLIEGLPKVVQEFFMDRAHTYTLATLRNYAYDLRGFFHWLSEFLGKPVAGADWCADLRFRHLRHYFRHLTGYDSRNRHGTTVRRTNSVRGFARKVSALSSLFDYLVAMEYMSENLLGSRERRRQLLGSLSRSTRRELPVYLTRDESKQMLAAVNQYQERRDHGASAERDRALLALLLFTGLRAGEVVSLDRASIQSEQFGNTSRSVLRVVGKGEKTRVVPLHPLVERLINQYLAARPRDVPPPHDAALFLNRYRQRMSTNAVWAIVRKYADRAGLPPKPKAISPHKLRHTFATLLLQEGHTTLQELQELLGHSSISTTTIYAHVANVRLRLAVESHPLGDLPVFPGDDRDEPQGKR